ncbi:MAG: hypothetical protein K2M11_00655 [Paramuribaculum sp.]|nr:hypothetical protein [Paramuribaculum sp.]
MIALCTIPVLADCGRRDAMAMKRLDLLAVDGTDSFPADYHPGVEAWMRFCGRQGADVDSFWNGYARSKAVEVFSPDVKERIEAEIPEIEEEIGAVKARMAQLYPEVRFPAEVYALVSPYSQSIMVADSVMLIALNHYLGGEYEGYEGMPAEQRALKNAANIPADVAEALIRAAYPFGGDEWSPLCAKMLYEGAVAVALKRVAHASGALAAGVSDENFEILEDNEENIWRSLVEGGELFSTSPRVADELLKPYPSRKYPARAGRYIGWRMAESAIKKGVSPAALLSADFYLSDNALAKTGYSPLK